MRRSVTLTYEYVQEKLGDPSGISLRKQFCLQYLKWGVTCNVDDRDEFVELAKRWRKEEARVGSKRTILEVKARKFFKKAKQRKIETKRREGNRAFAKEQMSRNEGIHTEEEKQKRRERAMLSVESRRKSGKWSAVGKFVWRLTNIETGEVVETLNLQAWTRENGYAQPSFWQAEKKGKPIKGWMVEKYNPAW